MGKEELEQKEMKDEQNKNEGKNEEMYTIYEAVIHRINKLCEERDMSIYELALLSDVPQSTLNELMQGRTLRPRVDTIKKICYGLNITMIEFFSDPVFQKIEGLDDQDPPERLKKRRRKNKKEKSNEGDGE